MQLTTNEHAAIVSAVNHYLTTREERARPDFLAALAVAQTNAANSTLAVNAVRETIVAAFKGPHTHKENVDGSTDMRWLGATVSALGKLGLDCDVQYTTDKRTSMRYATLHSVLRADRLVIEHTPTAARAALLAVMQELESFRIHLNSDKFKKEQSDGSRGDWIAVDDVLRRVSEMRQAATYA